MRFFLGIILLLICVFIGYIKTSKYYLRKMFFDDFVKFNNSLKQEVSFRQGTIIDLLQQEKSQNAFYKEINRIFYKKEKMQNDLSYLNQDEIKFFNDYVEKIGAGDKVSQMNFLENVSDEIDNKQKQCSLENEKYRKLYIKLGFFIGLILLILVL